MEAVLTGGYKDFRKARKEFANEAISDFETAKEAKLMEIKNVPVFSALGMKLINFYLRSKLAIKTPEEKILKQYSKLEKMKKKYLKNKS
jgi:hypothetical protein